MLNILMAAMLFILTIAVYAPLSPKMIASGLDASWESAMNEAIAQRLQIGQDIVFPFGPYAYLYTSSYHPETDKLSIIGGIYLAFFTTALLLVLSSGKPSVWALLFCLIITLLLRIPDPIFYAYPILLSLTVYRITLDTEDINVIHLPQKYLAMFAMLFTPLSLLSLIKGSYLITSALVLLFCCLFLWYKGRKLLVLYATAFTTFSLLIFWLLTGQSISGLPLYFSSLFQITSGYTEAMANEGSHQAIIYYIIASGAIILAIIKSNPSSKSSKIFLAVTIASILLITFKGGFVRHITHASIASTSLIIIATLLNLTIRQNYLYIVTAFCFIVFLLIDKGHASSTSRNIASNAKRVYIQYREGLINRITGNNVLVDLYSEKIDELRQEINIPSMPGSTDIYSFQQSYLFASNNKWKPRPVFQSYCAYTPRLAAMNEKHLYGSDTPDNLIFRVEPIDNRFPAIEDGRSWPAIIENYTPITMENGFVYLKKKKRLNSTFSSKKIYNKDWKFGKDFNIPETEDALFAELDIDKTLFGRFYTLLFKPPRILITVKIVGGGQVTFRLISTMAKSGFIISPLIQDTYDFVFLFNQNQYLRHKRVKTISISSTNSWLPVWKDSFSVKLSELKLPSARHISGIVDFDRAFETVPDYSVSPSQVHCEGNIDSLNGSTINTADRNVYRTLAVSGWLAVSLNEEIAPDDIYAVLTNEQNERKFIRARIEPSPDVNQHFNKQNLGDVRFRFIADISGLNGSHRLTMARAYSNRLELCAQSALNFPINIKQADRK